MDKLPSPHFPRTWLIRLSPVFREVEAGLLRMLGLCLVKRLGRDLMLVKDGMPAGMSGSAAAFLGWRMPVDHSWPCVPSETPGFVEKAAQALCCKFGQRSIQTVVAGALDPSASNRYDQRLASNLRGRVLQLFSQGLVRDAEAQDPGADTLFVLVGKEGLFCGVASPRSCGGFHAGGIKFIRQDQPGRISRAGAKIAAALHQLRLDRAVPGTSSHWLELGASPGGMTAELLKKGYQVTAVDRAPLDPRLAAAEGLQFVADDAASFRPPPGARYEAILSDMNGDPSDAMARVLGFAGFLSEEGVVIFTLKLPETRDLRAMLGALDAAVSLAANAGLQVFRATHLAYNRHELTLFLDRGRTTETPL